MRSVYISNFGKHIERLLRCQSKVIYETRKFEFHEFTMGNIHSVGKNKRLLEIVLIPKTFLLNKYFHFYGLLPFTQITGNENKCLRQTHFSHHD